MKTYDLAALEDMLEKCRADLAHSASKLADAENKLERARTSYLLAKNTLETVEQAYKLVVGGDPSATKLSNFMPRAAIKADGQGRARADSRAGLKEGSRPAMAYKILSESGQPMTVRAILVAMEYEPTPRSLHALRRTLSDYAKEGRYFKKQADGKYALLGESA